MRCNNDNQLHKCKEQLGGSGRYSQALPREIAYIQPNWADNSALLSQLLSSSVAIFISRTNFVPYAARNRSTIFGNRMKSRQKLKRTLDIHVSARIKQAT